MGPNIGLFLKTAQFVFSKNLLRKIPYLIRNKSRIMNLYFRDKGMIYFKKFKDVLNTIRVFLMNSSKTMILIFSLGKISR